MIFDSVAAREAYRRGARDMFDHTDTRWAPWTLIDGNNKKAARIAALSRVRDALVEKLPSKPPAPAETR